MGFRTFHKCKTFPTGDFTVSPRIPFTTDQGTSSFPGQQKISLFGTDKGIFPAIFQAIFSSSKLRMRFSSSFCLVCQILKAILSKHASFYFLALLIQNFCPPFIVFYSFILLVVIHLQSVHLTCPSVKAATLATRPVCLAAVSSPHFTLPSELSRQILKLPCEVHPVSAAMMKESSI